MPYKFFLPRSFNQDAVENYFAKIRSQRCRAVNPTALHFRDSFKSLLIRDFFGSKSIGANCESTNIPDLFNVRGLINKMQNIARDENEISPETFNICKYISKLKNFELEKNIHKSITGYVSGWVAKTLKNINCDLCKSHIFTDFSPTENSCKLINEREYDCHYRKLKYCNIQFINSYLQSSVGSYILQRKL
jgi:hypothetical protein